MGYFDALASSSFKNLENGKRAFYPWGKLGKGYELQSEAQYEAVKRFVVSYYVVGLPLAVLMALSRNWIILAAGLPVLCLAYILLIRRYTRGLPTTGEKLTFKDSYEAQARRHNPVVLWLLLIVSLLFVAGGLAILLGAGDVLTALLCIAFFGACAGVAGWMLLARHRLLRQADPEQTRIFD